MITDHIGMPAGLADAIPAKVLLERVVLPIPINF